jgi:predicted DNA-binding protein (MmcQ/YjbR family)
MNKLTKEQLKSYTGLRVKDLKKFIEKNNVPDDALVLIERVEDKYYEEIDISGINSVNGVLPENSKTNGWGVYLKEAESYYDSLLHNKRIREGYYFNKEEFPDLKEGSGFFNELSEEELEKTKTQYHPAWSCVKYIDEDDLLFINLHY